MKSESKVTEANVLFDIFHGELKIAEDKMRTGLLPLVCFHVRINSEQISEGQVTRRHLYNVDDVWFRKRLLMVARRHETLVYFYTGRYT